MIYPFDIFNLQSHTSDLRHCAGDILYAGIDLEFFYYSYRRTVKYIGTRFIALGFDGDDNPLVIPIKHPDKYFPRFINIEHCFYLDSKEKPAINPYNFHIISTNIMNDSASTIESNTPTLIKIVPGDIVTLKYPTSFALNLKGKIRGVETLPAGTRCMVTAIDRINKTLTVLPEKDFQRYIEKVMTFERFKPFADMTPPPDHPVDTTIIAVHARRRAALRKLADKAISFALDELGSTTPAHLRAIKGCAHAMIRGHVYSDYLPATELDKIVEQAVEDAVAGIK